MSSSEYSRRDVLKQAAAGAAGAAGAAALPQLLSAPARRRRSTAGRREKARRQRPDHHRLYRLRESGQNVDGSDARAGQIVAVADCYLKRAHDAVHDKHGKWNVYQDYRRMLDNEKLDAVVIATPEHVRSRIAILACMAGKDVYAEKPLTVYIAEGRAVVNAARKYQRVFQVGSQQRTMELNRAACEFIRDGGLGKLSFVQGVNYPGPRRYKGLPAEAIPVDDNWDAWCGPTELRPFNSQLQFAWMQWRSYSGGEMTNWVAHGVDQIQWALGMNHSGPVELWPVTPGTNGKVSMRYANGVEVRMELDHGPMEARSSRRRTARSRSIATSSQATRPI